MSHDHTVPISLAYGESELYWTGGAVGHLTGGHLIVTNFRFAVPAVGPGADAVNDQIRL